MKKWLLLLVSAAVIVGGIGTALVVTGVISDETPMQVSSVEVEKRLTLIVTYVGPAPPCETPTRVEVEESDTTVELRAWAGDLPDGPCPAAGKILTTKVELEEPLGTRTVIDGRNGNPVVVSGRDD